MGEGCTGGCQSSESQPHGVLCVEPTFWNQGRQEHHQIRVEGLKFVKNALTGEADYIEWVEGVTKTHQGGLVKKQRRVPRQAYATGGIRCPVCLLKKLVSKQPENMKTTWTIVLDSPS